MKSAIRIAIVLGVIATAIVAVYTAPAVAEDGSRRADAEVELSGNPCDAANNYRRYYSSRLEEQGRRQEVWDRTYEELSRARDDLDRMLRGLRQRYPVFNATLPPFADRHLILEQALDWLAASVQEYRESGLYNVADDYEYKLSQLRNARDRYNAAVEAESQACYRYWEWYWDTESIQTTLTELETACNTTLVQSPPFSEILAGMEDPMGPDERKARLNGQHAIPAQAQKPQSGQRQAAMPEPDTNSGQSSPLLATPMVPANLLVPVLPEANNQQGSLTATPAQAQTQPTPELTGQTMQVHQPATTTTNTGSSAVGYTHTQVPRNLGQSGAAVAPQKTLRSIAPIRQMRMLPQRSIKR